MFDPFYRSGNERTGHRGSGLGLAIGREPTATEREQLEVLRRLTSVLDAQLIVEEGDDVASVAIRTARKRGTTYVFMGAPSARRGVGRLTEPVALKIVSALPDVDVRLVAQRSASG